MNEYQTAQRTKNANRILDRLREVRVATKDELSYSLNIHSLYVHEALLHLEDEGIVVWTSDAETYGDEKLRWKEKSNEN